MSCRYTHCALLGDLRAALRFFFNIFGGIHEGAWFVVTSTSGQRERSGALSARGLSPGVNIEGICTLGTTFLRFPFQTYYPLQRNMSERPNFSSSSSPAAYCDDLPWVVAIISRSKAWRTHVTRTALPGGHPNMGDRVCGVCT